MIVFMELSRRTWSAAFKLAVVLSALAALVAVGVSLLGDVPEAAVVIPVIVVAFGASWVQTGRVRREAVADFVVLRPFDRVA
jgi:hypothetical protein